MMNCDRDLENKVRSRNLGTATVESDCRGRHQQQELRGLQLKSTINRKVLVVC